MLLKACLWNHLGLSLNPDSGISKIFFQLKKIIHAAVGNRSDLTTICMKISYKKNHIYSMLYILGETLAISREQLREEVVWFEESTFFEYLKDFPIKGKNYEQDIKWKAIKFWPTASRLREKAQQSYACEDVTRQVQKLSLAQKT